MGQAEDMKDAAGRRFAAILSIVACPACRQSLIHRNDSLVCSGCAARFPIRGRTILFTQPMGQDDALDSLKNRLKRLLGRFYYTVGVGVIAPTFPFAYRKHVRRFLDENAVVVDIGSGNHRIDDRVITLDGTAYDAVDIVADLSSLPFRSESVDGIISRSVLEHIPDLSRLLSEIKRCVREGGYSAHLIPFLFPYHASPDDFQRLTASGAARLFEGWDIIEQRAATGPVTLFLVCFIEFLSTVFSFGWAPLKAVEYLVLCGILFPLKFLDVFFVGRRAFLGLAPSIFTVARKPSDPEKSS